MAKELYRELASLVVAMRNCDESGNAEWHAKHKERAEALCRDRMPSGSGFDSGTVIDWDETRPNRLRFTTSFHRMDENGFYDGWVDFRVTVKPDLASGFDLHVAGGDDDLADYVGDVFHAALSEIVA